MIHRLVRIMARLRDPRAGCEWDTVQTFETIAPYTIEEAYEVADAIARGDMADLKDELGDLLLQVVFHARMAEEAGLFDLSDVAAAISDKMERRHPHIFGDRTEGGHHLWEQIKAEERAARRGADVAGALDGVALSLPALLRADKLQKRAARTGFDWPDPFGARAKIAEEIDEIDSASTADEREEEVGDLLFAVVNWARHLGIDAETALRRASAKFEMRFRAMEAAAGDRFVGLSLDEKEVLWQAVKRAGQAPRARSGGHMSMPGISRRAALAAPALAMLAPRIAAAEPRAHILTPTPPMGWNSWNSFATTITEAQALENAGIMGSVLKPHGYDVFTIDIQWYEPGARGYAYSDKPVPALDGHGRLLPAPNRFPSAAGGAGFAPLAAKVHALGLKFGVHLMRGIPRLAVERNLPVLGTAVRAREIADTGSTCPWNPDMFGVDMRRPGAQAYYDSVFALFASWGVDFVKMDDMSRPYDAHMPEIEAAHRAIAGCGRLIVLSLSPGETPLLRGAHVRRHAQMWRISDDFWDEWRLLKDQFERLEEWSCYRGPDAWPDADMLPLGRLAMGARDTRFTRDEQRTLMTLWSIARSPLIMGGDLRALDRWTIDLLTNDEVIAVNQRSIDNEPWYLADNTSFWTARSPDRKIAYIAMFNLADGPESAHLSFPLDRIGLVGGRVRDLWAAEELGTARGRIEATLPPHGSVLLSVR